MAETEALSRVEVVLYDPVWPERYAAERANLVGAAGDLILELEHIGSTAVPGLRSKPIIDMMAAVRDLRQGQDLAQLLRGLGYELIETGMRNRLFLRQHSESQKQAYQLHIVELSTWEQRQERLMRDYLLAHPKAAAAYGELKKRLAEEHTEDSLAYTRAKTTFIQDLIDKARAKLGLPSINVWAD
jgi:GrpB-like predicted nucleotidyltransferase (UPF0157 family)